jgi:hypothetical protein
MRPFRRLFALLFILSLFVGVVHQLSHTHHAGEVCEVCLLAHSPALVDEAVVLPPLFVAFESFDPPKGSHPTQYTLLTRNRSPPLT